MRAALIQSCLAHGHPGVAAKQPQAGWPLAPPRFLRCHWDLLLLTRWEGGDRTAVYAAPERGVVTAWQGAWVVSWVPPPNPESAHRSALEALSQLLVQHGPLPGGSVHLRCSPGVPQYVNRARAAFTDECVLGPGLVPSCQQV